MSQFTGLLSATGLGSIRNLGAEPPDVTPNAVNWNDVFSPSSATTNTVTITGINTAINLSISYTGYSVGTFSVYKNGTEFDLTNDNPYTLSVSNNDQVYFFYNASVGSTVSITVRNVSDGNTVLDTFTMTVDAPV